MKKNIIIGAVLLVLVAGAVFLIVRNRDDNGNGNGPSNGDQPEATERPFVDQEIEGLVFSGINVSWEEHESIFVANVENTNSAEVVLSEIVIKLLDDDGNEIISPIRYPFDEPFKPGENRLINPTISVNVSNTREVKIEIVK